MTQRLKQSLDDTVRKIFDKSQAALPKQDRCALLGEPVCLVPHDGYICTKVKDHVGDHCAHSLSGYVLERWPSARR